MFSVSTIRFEASGLQSSVSLSQGASLVMDLINSLILSPGGLANLQIEFSLDFVLGVETGTLCKGSVVSEILKKIFFI